jgi:hypothetical protein
LISEYLQQKEDGSRTKTHDFLCTRLGRTGIAGAGAPVLRATENNTDNPFVQDRRKINMLSGRSRPVSAATSTLRTRIPTTHSAFHPIMLDNGNLAHVSSPQDEKIGKTHVHQKAAWRQGGKGGVLAAASGCLS